jgi:hypothetical protein
MKKSTAHFVLIALAFVVVVAACAEPVGSETEDESAVDEEPQVLIDIEHTGSKGKAGPRYGFVLESYPGSSLVSVELLMASSVAGEEEIELIVSRNNYLSATAGPKGTFIGTATAVTNLRAHSEIDPFEWVAFEFDTAAFVSPPKPGDIVVFRLNHVSFDPKNPVEVYYAQDAANDGDDPRVIQTLDRADDSVYDSNKDFAIRRSYIPIRVTGTPAP